MSTLPTLPERFVPVQTLNLCSNVLASVQIPIAVAGFPVLLIDRGLVPIVWLAAPRRAGSSEWRFVVDEGRSVNPAIQVEIDKDKGETLVKTGDIVLVRARTMSSDEAIVTDLDLRPVGLAVTGDAGGLNVAGNYYASNRIQGSSIAISLG